MIKLNNDFGLIEKSKLQADPTKNSEILNLAQKSRKIHITTNVPQFTLSKILNEVKNLIGNKLNLKAKNFFVNFDKFEAFELLFSLYEQSFNFDEIRTFLTQRDRVNENIFTLMCRWNWKFSKPEHSKWQEMLENFVECFAQFYFKN